MNTNLKNKNLPAVLVVSWHNTKLVNIGSKVQVLSIAEAFPLITAHKIRTVELEGRKWGT